VVHQDAAHQLGGEAKEMRTVLPRRSALVDEPHVKLVNQGRRYERVIRTFPPQLFRGYPAQLTVHQREQSLEGLFIPVGPLQQQACDLSGRLCHDIVWESLLPGALQYRLKARM
jgi:hypothetical protein